jgi:ATP-dependent Lhr-like helicase
VLESFHPAVRTWFEKRFPAGPTMPQAEGWRDIAAGHHTLIAAPTGSGKTLAAFLVCIDRIYRAHEAGADPGAGPQVVYVSPLKALAVDIHLNLERPLAEIAEVAAGLGLSAPTIRVAVRTGDTAAAERAAMLKRPPDFLITTPESLYLLATAERGRAMLAAARTVIVDEIHAVAGNKRVLQPLQGEGQVRAAAADRAVGHPAAGRGGGAAAGRRGRGPVARRRVAAVRDRGRGAPPRPRSGPGAAQ